jgi:hypothetical protein
MGLHEWHSLRFLASLSKSPALSRGLSSSSVIFGEYCQMPGTVRDDARICRGCWDQMRVPIPIRGLLAVPFRIFGITQSKMNPNICTICERAFRRVKKHRHISATASILFADIRGYTRLSERMDPIELSNVVSAFQDQCAQGIWAQDGIVNKQMGDGLMAIFNFPIKNERHAEAAVMAALISSGAAKPRLFRGSSISIRAPKRWMLGSASTPDKSKSVNFQPLAAISLQSVAPLI